MNYLAHAFLSGNDPGIMFGNFIADTAGSDISRYSPAEQNGIRLHRMIDAYTDAHPDYQQSCRRIADAFGRYAPVVCDIYYDHFLSSLWKDYASEPLSEFSARLFRLLIANRDRVPGRLRKMLPHMIAYNWLEKYGSLEHLPRFFLGMSRRARFRSGMEKGSSELVKHYDELRGDFRKFMPDIIFFTETQILQLHL